MSRLPYHHALRRSTSAPPDAGQTSMKARFIDALYAIGTVACAIAIGLMLAWRG